LQLVNFLGKGILKGMVVTFTNLIRPSPTTQYPEQRLTVSRRIRGTELVWSKTKCTGCATCARTCPQGVIHVVTHKGENNNYAVDTFEVDSGYCIHCGLCVEACPYNALFMGYTFERSKYRRNSLVMSKDDMAIEHQPASGYFHPEIAQTLPEQELLVYRGKKK
jgi:NAD(P)H-quinone oxidoreductase subunit I